MADPMLKKAHETVTRERTITRERLAELLNEDLSREYQAIIPYVVYSQVLKGAEYMNIADQLEAHAHDELKHALIISRQIDYLGRMPSVTPSKTKTRRFANIVTAFGNAKRSANLLWPSKSGRF
jgi:bacterioferritin